MHGTDEIRIPSPTGVRGPGFPEASFEKALARQPRFIGCDASSTDPGPSHLGTGKAAFPREALKRDLRLMLLGALPTARVANTYASIMEIEQMGRFTALHVPYKGSAPGIADLMAGHVVLFFDGIPSALPHVKSGRVRALGVASSTRSPALPEVAAIGETLKGYEADSWFGIMVPAGTPRDTIARLNADVQKVLALQEIKDRLLAVGGFVSPGGPGELAQRVKSDVAKWGNVVRTAGIKAE